MAGDGGVNLVFAAAPLPWPFDVQHMQLALVAGLAIGISAPLVGTFLVSRQMAFMGDGIGHVAFAGVAAGLLVGVWPVWSALVVTVAGAVALEWLRSRGRASGDLALALFFYSGIAAGVVLTGDSEGHDERVLDYLFGSLLTVSSSDAWTVVALGVVAVTIIAFTWRALFSIVVDEESARVSGLPVDALNVLVAVLAAVVVVGAMRVVGVVLVGALMALPVGAAQRLVRGFRATLLASAAISAGCVLLGLTAARLWDLEPGGTIVLVAAATFALAAIAPRPHSTPA